MELSRVVGVVGELSRAYNYEVELPSEFVTSVTDLERIRILCYEVSLPPLINIEAERDFPVAPGYYLPRPTGIQVGEVVLRFWETEDKVVLRYFKNWRNKMIVLDSGRSNFAEFKLPKMYLRDVRVWVVDGQQRRRWGWRFVRSFPTRVDELRLSYTVSEVISVGVTLVCEYIEEL